MITDNDIVFEFDDSLSNKNERDYSYFGWEWNGVIAFETIAEGYFTAAESVYQRFASLEGDKSELDMLGYPICFLYLHYVNLYIQGLYYRYTDKGVCENFLEQHHCLKELWDGIEPSLRKLTELVASSVSVSALKSYVYQMHEFAQKYLSMLYPRRENFTAESPESLKLNVVNLHARMNDFKNAIEKLNCDLSDLAV